MFKAVEKMLERVSQNGTESDTDLFHELLYAGELILKVTTAAFVAALDDDREHHRYRIVHGLVRADGIGDWSKALDDMLTGPASQCMAPTFRDIRNTFTERVGKGAWQHSAVHDMQDVLLRVHGGAPSVGDRVALRAWGQFFVEVRNKTRGHGAITPAIASALAPTLQESISLICRNNPIFSLPWAYIHRNMSGKYRVVDLGDGQEAFSRLKTSAALGGPNYSDGVYIFSGHIRRVELIHSDVSAIDFYFPNGAFRNGKFEYHSLISDSRTIGDGAPYMAIPGQRPPSETEGKGELDILGQVFTNLPSGIVDYIPRPDLEAEVRRAATNDRHPIVTLVGSGGIGKTSVALKVLAEIAETDRYKVIIWFSSRDIDLLMVGAKVVRPKVLTDKDMADEYRSLLGDVAEVDGKKIPAVELMARHLHSSPHGPTLFVFDNFETVRSPVDLFQWIDTNIRLPNKAIITTRFRDFKADYPIEVHGMELPEARALVDQMAAKLGIASLLSERNREEIIEDSNAHPYVIKIMMGEIANSGKYARAKILLARKDDILDALVERTFVNLTPIASRIFLMLSAWRSLVPQLAVEAVMLRHGPDVGDPEAGIDQLVRMSLAERKTAADGSEFLQVPLAATLFGKKKLEVSPLRAMIEEDLAFLQDVGAVATGGLKAGLRPRIQMFFKRTAQRINNGSLTLEDARPVLEFLARSWPPAWMLLSILQEEVGGPDVAKKAAEDVRRFLESRPSTEEAQVAWQQLFALYRAAGDVVGACGALMNVAAEVDPPFSEISYMANWLNNSGEILRSMDMIGRRQFFLPLIGIMETRIREATATDLSRLAWMYLHIGDEQRALGVAHQGLDLEDSNVHCQRLVAKLLNH